MEKMEAKYPIEIKQAWVKQLIAGLFVLVLGLFLLLMAGSEQDYFMVLLSIFLLVMGIFVLIVSLSSIHRILLKIDEKEIGYFPFRKKMAKTVQWKDVSEYGIYPVSAGRSTQWYLKINVVNPDDYLTVAQEKTNRRWQSLSGADVNSVLLIPINSLHIKRKNLAELIESEFNKHQAERENREAEVAEKKEAEMKTETTALPENPILSTEEQGKKRRLSYILTVGVILLFILIGIIGYFIKNNQYAGLSSNQTYIVTSNSKNPDFEFMFRIYDESGYKNTSFLAAGYAGSGPNQKELEQLSNQLTVKKAGANKTLSTNDGLFVSTWAPFKKENHGITFDFSQKDKKNGKYLGVGEILFQAKSFKLKDLKKEQNYWLATFESPKTSDSSKNYPSKVRIYSYDEGTKALEK